ncbi:MAG: 3-deoxy-D-manno-octulosonate 8-phosphate phosphatase [Beggiatoa sp. IS2]|nr:MAG: 3-deoxy-D-manno-octulosonate 8-phosphate phosphatase [Beggiatoa sp. IS2]
MKERILARAARIRLVIFDVDGVLTDGSLYLGDDGQEYKAFHATDGMGMHLLLSTGVKIGIITGNISQVVMHRMHNLGVQYVFQGQIDKVPAFRQLCADLQLAPEQVAYVGDDINDVPVLSRVGLAIAVANAHPLVVNYAHWQTHALGGRGAAREVCELIMQAQGTLAQQFGRFLI